jgi:hypothetical protein
MKYLINRDSFEAIGADATGEAEEGSVEVTLQGKAQRVKARRFSDGWILALDMVGRYHTSTKQWDARIFSRPQPDGSFREDVRFGRDDNHPKFRKANCIFFKK